LEGAVNLDNVTRDDWIVGGLALVLAIFLFVLPWFDLSVGPFSVTFTATDDPDGWLAILGAIASLLVVADLALERFSPQTDVPTIGSSRTNTRFVLACVAAGFVALKFLFHIHFSLFGWGFYVNVLATVALVYVAYQARAGVPLAFGAGGVGSANVAAASGPSRTTAPSQRPPQRAAPSPPAAEPAEPAGPPSSSSGAGAGPGSPGGSTPPPGS
jgi:hypothetical protein